MTLASPSPDEEETLIGLMMAAVWLTFRLRAMGEGTAVMTARGGSVFGLLHALIAEGPQTVPDLARARPVTRQHIQVLADELEAEGLVAYRANPRHRRSKLVQPTEAGRARYRALRREIAAVMAELAADLPPADLATTRRVLAVLLERAGNRLLAGRAEADREAGEAPTLSPSE